MSANTKKSKWFRVAREGATSDGRKIERQHLVEMAASYSPATYGARIFAEHIRGISPDSPFQAFGDVTALKTETHDGKLSLYAQIEPTAAMIELVGRKQKIYSSIEIAPDFAGTGKSYLVGLGITDSPASLGTEVLAFAASNPDANPFNSRKQAAGNLIVAAEESQIEFDDAEDPGPTLLERVRGMFARKQASDDQGLADIHAAVEEVASQTGRQGERMDELRREFAALQTAQTTAARELADLTTRINNTTDGTGTRPGSTGAPVAEQTDC